MKRWKKRAFAAAVCITVLLTGCSQPIPDMTEEQSAMVAEYAAGLLLKYDKNYSESLPEAAEALPDNEIEEAVTPEAEAENTETAEEASSVQESTPEETIVTDIAGFLGLSGIDITYTGYEFADSYEEGESLAFSLDATPGNRLLIVKFDMTNYNGEDTEVNILDRRVRFGLIPNQGKRKPVLYTMLLNDLSIYKNVVAAGATEQALLISEIPQEEAMLDNLSLYIKNETDAVTITLE